MEKLSECIKSFLQHCKYEKNLSEKTLKAYTIDLKQFECFVEKDGADAAILAISKFVIRNYVQGLSLFKPKTLKRKIAVLKSLFNYLEFEDIITINPFRKLRLKIKEAKVIPKALTLIEIEKIISSAYNSRDSKFQDNWTDKETLRNICLLEILFTTGARVSEIVNIKCDQINIESGLIVFKGKGNKERQIQIFSDQVKKVLKECSALFQEEQKRVNFFFINRFGGKLSDQSARGVVKKFAKAAALNKKVTPHMFRHSFATLLLEKDVDIKYIQHFLGHSSIATTQIYTQVNSHKTLSILEDRHPRSKIQFGYPIKDN